MSGGVDDEPVVMLTATYDARAESVWEAWTDPAIVSRWYGCEPDRLWTIHEWDPRVGGRLHVSMAFDRPGTEPPEIYSVRGEFVIVESPRRLVYTFGDGQRVEVSIEPSANTAERTSVTVRHHGLPPDGPGTDEMGAILSEGWSSSLTQLTDLL